jgi:hypothetical protein
MRLPGRLRLPHQGLGCVDIRQVGTGLINGGEVKLSWAGIRTRLNPPLVV